MGQLLGRIEELTTPGPKGADRLKALGAKAWSMNVQLQQILPDLVDLQDQMTGDNYNDIRALSKAVNKADGALVAIKSGYAMREDSRKDATNELAEGFDFDSAEMQQLYKWDDQAKAKAVRLYQALEDLAGKITTARVKFGPSSREYERLLDMRTNLEAEYEKILAKYRK
jgi:hypothetical protein